MSEPIAYAFTNTGVFSSHDGNTFAVNATANVSASTLGNSVFINSTSVSIGNTTNLYTVSASAFDSLAYNGLQINGSMDVSQENGTTQITLAQGVGTYITDGNQVRYAHVAGTAVFKAQQVTPPGSPPFGLAFPNCIQLTATTALTSPASGDTGLISIPIEGYRWSKLGYGTINAQPLTIGFWIYASVVGTMTCSIGTGLRSYMINITINNPTTWEYKTVTVPGDQSSTWITTNGIGSRIRLAFCAGSSLQGPANTWQDGGLFGTPSTTNFFATNGNFICCTGVIAVPGTQAPSASRSPLIMRPFDQELLLCRRYFETLSTNFLNAIGLLDGVTIFTPSSLPMRVSPTVTHPFTDANFTNTGVPGTTQWNLQVPNVATATKTGTASFSYFSSTSPGLIAINIYGCTFSRTTNLIGGGATLGVIKLDARL